jgi:PAS domain S-box-containing protein
LTPLPFEIHYSIALVIDAHFSFDEHGCQKIQGNEMDKLEVIESRQFPTRRIEIPTSSHLFFGVVAAISTLPFLLTLLGVDFGSIHTPLTLSPGTPGFTDALFFHQRGAFTHILFEWTAFCAAIVVFVLAVVQHRNNPTFLISTIAVALLCSGVMDAFHALAATRLTQGSAPYENLIPFTWSLSRVFHALVMILGVGIILRRRHRPSAAHARNAMETRFLIGVGLFFAVLSYAAIHICATLVELPQTMFPDSTFSRPYDMVPLILFILAGIFLYVPLYRSKPNFFSYALLVSLIPNIATQAHMAFGSTALFDSHFNIAHFLKVVAYTVPIAGLCFDFHSQVEVLSRIEKINATKLEAIVANIGDGVFVIDDKGKISSFSEASEQIFGYSKAAIVGCSISAIIPSFALQSSVSEFIESGKIEVGDCREFGGLRNDGSDIPLELVVGAMLIDGAQFYTGIVRDITARKRAEKTLADQNLAIQQVLQRRAKYDRCENKVLQLFNKRDALPELLKELLNILAEELKLSPSSVHLFDEETNELRLAVSNGLPRAFQRSFKLGEGLVGEVAVSQQGCRIEQPDLKEHGISIETGIDPSLIKSVLLEPLFHHEWNLGVLTVAEQSDSSQQQLDFISQLARRISVAVQNVRQYEQMKELTNQLNKSSHQIALQNEELQQSNRLKSEFLANMSHELRTPLNAIIGFSELMGDGLLGELNAKQATYTKEILSSGRHLLSLINDILDLSKIEAGKMELELEKINVRDLCRNALTIVKEQAHRKRIDMSFNISDEAPTFVADRGKIKQILYNLLANGIKFTPDSGTVALEFKRVVEDGSACFLFSVTDSGIGVSEEDQSRLFQPFEQLDGSTARHYGGTGLGLNLVKRLTELHGGRVFVESQLGVGSRFDVIIPSLTCGQQPTDGNADVELSEGAILLIEDDDAVADVLMIALTQADYCVKRAATAEQGLAMIHDTKPDLIVIDICLDGRGGLELLSELKENEETDDLPVVIVSIVGDEICQKGFAVGVIDVFQKPVNTSSLLEVIGHRQSQSALPVAARVLVVDDDPDAVELVSIPLENKGLRIFRAHGGREALELIDREKIDLIILDLMMPEITGFDVLIGLNKHCKRNEIAVIAVTAKDLDLEDRQFLEKRVEVLMQKSDFKMGSFLYKVRQALHGKKPTSGSPV